MSITSKTAKRTCAALVVGLAHQPNPSWWVHSQPHHCCTNALVAVVPHILSSRTQPTMSGSRRWLTSSSFQPPIPPQSQGQAVYPDMDLASSSKNDVARQRNSDPAAVFVVTGASRGIGLQFVKTLLATTQVRSSTEY
jgi:hypothetical protein